VDRLIRYLVKLKELIPLVLSLGSSRREVKMFQNLLNKRTFFLKSKLRVVLVIFFGILLLEVFAPEKFRHAVLTLKIYKSMLRFCRMLL
jgi:hypothetical protein